MDSDDIRWGAEIYPRLNSFCKVCGRHIDNRSEGWTEQMCEYCYNYYEEDANDIISDR